MSGLVFIRDEKGFREFRGQLMPLIQRCVDRAVHGEYRAEDVEREIKSGRAVAFCAEEDGEIVLAAFILFYFWPTGKLCAELETLAGRDLEKYWVRYRKTILDFLRNVGVDAFIAQCSPAMERLLAKTGDWHPLYRVVECNLGDRHVHAG